MDMAYDDIQEFELDNSTPQNGEVLDNNTQNDISRITNKEYSQELKKDTKTTLQGAVLGAVIGSILCLYRRKNVWLGVLAGGLIGGYLTREGVIKLNKNKKNGTNN